MASDEALRSTNEKANFQRLTRLLMRGGETLLRAKFDSICPPTSLPIKLSDTAVQTQLRSARLTRPEWNCLYPSPGVYGKSTDFDITLTFRLLRTICNLAPPPTGWDNLPSNTDHSLEADLVRIKYYRNEVYGHSKTLEVSEADFVNLWSKICEALLRIAASISHRKRDEWKKVIDRFLFDPLTPGEERCVEELHQWYKQDMDVKEELEKMGETYQAGITTLNENLQGGHERLLQEIQALREDVKQYKNLVQVLDNTVRNHLLKVTDPPVENKDDRGELPDKNQNSFIENQITEQFRQLRTLSVDLQHAFHQWITIRARLMERLQKLATELHEAHFLGNVAAFTGAFIGTAGGILSIASFGLIAVPFTFGAGFLLSIAGVGIGGVGGVILAGSKAIEMINAMEGFDEVQAVMEKDREARIELQQQLDSLENFVSGLAEFLRPLHADPMLLRPLESNGFEFLRERIFLEDFDSSMKERAETGAKFFRGVTSVAAISASAAVGPVISAVLLPLDITLLVKLSLELLNCGSTSKAVEGIKEIMKGLECPDEEEIQGLVESFIDEKFTEAYNREIECDKQREYQADDEDNDFDDGAQYDDETSLAMSEKPRLLLEEIVCHKQGEDQADDEDDDDFDDDAQYDDETSIAMAEKQRLLP